MSTGRPGTVATTSGTPDSVFVDPYEPEYPQSDGKPMAESTLQYQWIVTMKEGLEVLFADRADVFVAADLLWYATKSDKTDVVAPDVLVVFGRPKGHRRSYREWVEEGIGPQVVFEIDSPSNTAAEMARKLAIYDRRGVEEYYYYDPESGGLEGWRRHEGSLRAIPDLEDWISPRLGIRFEAPPGRDLLVVRKPDGDRFLTFAEMAHKYQIAGRRVLRQTKLRRRAERLADSESRRADSESRRADSESRRAEAEARRAEEERRLREDAEAASRAAADRAARLEARLRELGEAID